MSTLNNVRTVTLTETIQFRVKGKPFIIPEGTAIEIGEVARGRIDLDGNTLDHETPYRGVYQGVRFQILPGQFTTAQPA